MVTTTEANRFCDTKKSGHFIALPAGTAKSGWYHANLEGDPFQKQKESSWSMYVQRNIVILILCKFIIMILYNGLELQ